MDRDAECYNGDVTMTSCLTVHGGACSSVCGSDGPSSSRDGLSPWLHGVGSHVNDKVKAV